MSSRRDPTLARALAALTARGGETLPLIERLVRINSHSANVVGVNAVGNLLIESLASLPLNLTVQTSDAGVRHLSFATALAATAPSILLIGHHDTVFPPGEFERFEISEGVARGPGVLDMKGGLCLIVQLLRALHDVALLELMPLCFVSVGDEEIGSPDSRTLLESLVPSSRLALVFEAGRAGDAIITARRGSGSARVVAHGKAAHAGNALSEGRNAIWALAKYIDRVQALNGSIEGASLNVGLVSGGSARNTVPERASAELDLRFSDSAGQSALFAALERAAREVEGSLEGTRLELTPTVARKPWARSAESAALAQRYAAAQRAAGLSASEAPVMGGGSDANTVGALGLPAIDGLGPSGKGFHTHSEYIELASLPKKAEALLRFVLAECQIAVE
jgi:glutamate carboxypeptidase